MASSPRLRDGAGTNLRRLVTWRCRGRCARCRRMSCGCAYDAALYRWLWLWTTANANSSLGGTTLTEREIERGERRLRGGDHRACTFSNGGKPPSGASAAPAANRAEAGARRAAGWL